MSDTALLALLAIGSAAWVALFWLYRTTDDEWYVAVAVATWGIFEAVGWVWWLAR
jgi:hypothetical protein